MILDSVFKILSYLFVPLVLTVLVECLLVFVLFKKPMYMYYVLLLNILTNPLLNFVMLLYFSYVGMKGYYILLYALEVVVVAAEGLIFAKLTDMEILKALGVSLLLNGCSYASGLLFL